MNFLVIIRLDAQTRALLLTPEDIDTRKAGNVRLNGVATITLAHFQFDRTRVQWAMMKAIISFLLQDF